MARCQGSGVIGTPSLPGRQRGVIELDKLQQEAEKLLALLKDRQTGLMTWNEFLRERLKNLHELTAQDLGE